MIGTKLAHYEITNHLGSGGMGDVYQATDSKLGRSVAVKLLPESFSHDADRVARFEREARVLASLNHPNIAAIYGLEDSKDKKFLVMELVPGETLAERILRGPIPIDDSAAIAKQIAEALEAAHEKGVIHRDLKPANIKVTADGKVKVLDFGLAKATEQDSGYSALSNSPTIATMATNAGVIFGTAGYMSPEQASGKPVDKRSDVWSFGVVLWEMLSGKRLFEAETISHTLADVLRSPIEFDTLPAAVPRSIRGLLRRCLDRNVQHRLRDIGEARIMLEAFAGSSGLDELENLPAASTPQRSRVAWAVAGVLALALGTVGFGWWRATRPIDQPLIRLSVDLGPEALPGLRTTAILSPDGTRIVFSIRNSNGVRQLATRTLDQPKATAMAGTEGGFDAFFSPDGQWIGFFADGKLKKAPVQGGAPIILGDAGDPRGGAWGDDGNIVFSPTAGFNLMRVPSSGGTPEPLTKIDNRRDMSAWPQVLPGAKGVLFTMSTNPFNWEDADIGVISAKSGQAKIVQHGGYAGRYLPSPHGAGHLLYVHDSTLYGVRFDPDRLETLGTPVPLLTDVGGNYVDGVGQFDGAMNGSFVYVSGKSAISSSYPITWLDNSGKTTPLVAKPGMYGAPRFSPDGKRLAFTAVGNKGPDLWVYDWERDTPTQLTFTAPGNLEMAWTPDGKHIVYGSNPEAGTASLWWIRSDGSGEPQKLLERKNTGVGLRPQSFTPDGRRLAYDDNVKTGAAVEIWTLPLDLTDPERPKPGTPEPFLTTALRQVDASFSPDGKWIAYSSNESGIDDIFVRPFPGPGGKWRVSSAGGKFPTWSRTGRELFYFSLGDSRIMVANYTIKGDSFTATKPQVWSDRQVLLPNFIRVLDVHPDGKRFAVFPRPEVEETKGNLHVTFLLNFSDELHRRSP